MRGLRLLAVSVFLVLLVLVVIAALAAPEGYDTNRAYRAVSEYVVRGVYNGSRVDLRVACVGRFELRVVGVQEQYNLVKLESRLLEPVRCGAKGSRGPLNVTRIESEARRALYAFFHLERGNESVFTTFYYQSRPGSLYIAPGLLEDAPGLLRGATERFYFDYNYTTGALKMRILTVHTLASSYDRRSGLLEYYRSAWRSRVVYLNGTSDYLYVNSLEVRSGLLPPLALYKGLILEVLAAALAAVAVGEYLAIRRLRGRIPAGGGGSEGLHADSEGFE